MLPVVAILIFLLIIAAVALVFTRSQAAPLPDAVPDDFPSSDIGAPEGATPAVPPTTPPGGPTTQDTGGGPVPVKPV